MFKLNILSGPVYIVYMKLLAKLYLDLIRLYPVSVYVFDNNFIFIFEWFVNNHIFVQNIINIVIINPKLEQSRPGFLT